jgi:protein-tyrosine phosphatase
MIDLHCHLLPGIDDGPKTLEEALALARASVLDGITHAVVTPHVFAGQWDNTLTTILPHFVKFQAALTEAEIGLKISLGGEVRLLPESLALLSSDDMPFLGGWNGKKVVLLELPDAQIPVGTTQAIDYLLKRNIVPMIAHPERNKDVMRAPEKIAPFLEAGCLLQLTAASVCGKFGQPAFETANALLDADVVTVIATDTHNLQYRPPILNDAQTTVAEKYGEDRAERLTLTNPDHIVSSRVELGLAP